MNLTASERARFRTKQERVGDCLVWLGPLDKDGYGTFHLRRKNRRAHRVAWYDSHGEIPEGLVMNHTCGNRACVNVQHLQLVTPRENSLDSRSPVAVNARKTECKNGHPFDRVYGGQRCCSICDAAKHKRLRAKWRAEDTLRV